MPKLCALLLAVTAISVDAASIPSSSPAIERGYREMYDLRFDQAHPDFLPSYSRQNPNDPLSHASNAAAYLFAEFDRLHILQGEFFLHDSNFRQSKKLAPDPVVKASLRR